MTRCLAHIALLAPSRPIFYGGRRRRSPSWYVDMGPNITKLSPRLCFTFSSILSSDTVMQRYQPPHLRRHAEQQEEAKRAAAARHAAAWATPAAAGPSSRPTPATYTPRAPRPASNGPSHIQPQAPHASRRNWSTPDRSTANVLASPASDLQPMRRTPVKDIDAMDMIQSVSRSGGDGAEGDAWVDS